MKILDKIKEFFVGEDRFSDTAKKIKKNKKLTNEEKLILLNEAFFKCLDKELDNEAITSTFEFFYEEFVIDGVTHEQRFNAYLNHEKDMIATIYLKDYFDGLNKYEENCDLTLLSKKDLYLINKVKELSGKCDINTYEFGDYFKGRTLIRSKKSLAIEEFIKDIKNNCLESKNEINKSEEIDEIFSL